MKIYKTKMCQVWACWAKETMNRIQEILEIFVEIKFLLTRRLAQRREGEHTGEIFEKIYRALVVRTWKQFIVKMRKACWFNILAVDWCCAGTTTRFPPSHLKRELHESRFKWNIAYIICQNVKKYKIEMRKRKKKFANFQSSFSLNWEN